MKIDDTKKSVISAVSLILIAAIAFLFWYTAKYSTHAIEATQKCGEIFLQKATGYFGQNGINRFIFSKKENTCLIFNTFIDEVSGNYRLMVVDMITDDIDFYYELKKDETKDTALGLTKDEAVNKVRSFGFVIF